MKRTLLVVALFLFAVSVEAGTHVKAPAPLAAASELAVRVLGAERAARFVFDTGVEASYGPGANGLIAITAPTAGDAAMTLGAYLREVAQAHWGWCGSRFPETMPTPSTRRTVKRNGEIAFAYNYCVHAYTFAFMGEKSWRAEIDRLALFGFNRALVVQGLSAVWQGFMRDLGMPEHMIRLTICDAPAAPFWNMGNVEGIGAPVANDVIAREAKLGVFIVREMRRLGIEPVLQGFVGFLPHRLASDPEKYGLADARILKQGKWCGLERPEIIAPTDPQFHRLAKIWYRNLFKVYQTNYAAGFAGDLFHEGGRSDGVDVTAAYRAVQREQQLASPGAVWALMAWGNNPTPAMVAGMDPKYTLIERLVSDMTLRSLKPRDFGPLKSIWCEILNFGGRTGYYGAAELVEQLPLMGAGWGLHSEGQETNPWFYEEFTRKITGGAKESTAAYARRRYGIDEPKLVRALDLLRGSICASKAERDPGPNGYGSIGCLFPSWYSEGHHASIRRLNYDTADVVRARNLYREVAAERPELLKLETFLFDYVDVQRQVLSDRQTLLFPLLKTVPAARSEFLRIMEEMEDLLAQCPTFRLDTMEKRACELDPKRGPEGIRRMVTTWSNQPWQRGALEEYATRMYAGCMRDFHLPRWKLFFEEGGHTRRFWEQERAMTRKFIYGHDGLAVCAFPGKRLADVKDKRLQARMTGACIGTDCTAQAGTCFAVGKDLVTCFVGEDTGFTKVVIVKLVERADGVWAEPLAARYVKGVDMTMRFLEVTADGKCVYHGVPMALAFDENGNGYALRDFAIKP